MGTPVPTHIESEDIFLEAGMDGIYGFFGKYRFLSNFWLCPVVDEMGILYPSSEHAYQAQKTTDAENRRYIAEANGPKRAKHYGYRVQLRKDVDWDTYRRVAMEDVIMWKFSQNMKLREMLLSTEGRYLEETNSWGDTYFGVCKGTGQNVLGQILMETREYFRRFSNAVR